MTANKLAKTQAPCKSPTLYNYRHPGAGRGPVLLSSLVILDPGLRRDDDFCERITQTRSSTIFAV